MNIFKVNYNIQKTGGQFDVTVVANDKQKAINLIAQRVGSNIKVNSISAYGVIHAISEEVINKLSNPVDNSKLNKKTKELEEFIELYKKEIEDLNTEINVLNLKQDKKQDKYICPYCDYKTESGKGFKIHLTKNHT